MIVKLVKKRYILLYIFLLLNGFIILNKYFLHNNQEITLGDTIPGDVDGNGIINSLDYVLIRKHVIGKSFLLNNQQPQADVNNDGTINTLDYLVVKQSILSGVAISPLPPTVSPEPIIKSYDLRNVAVIDYFNDSSRDVVNIFKNQNCGDSLKCDSPKLYTPSITGAIQMYLYDDTNKTKTSYKIVNNQDELTNSLIPGNTYYLESVNDASVYEYVKVENTVRMIYSESGIRNIRDIGGYVADGGTVKYDKLFRGANPNISKRDKIFENLGIDSIVDLRSKADFSAASSYFTKMNKYNYGITGYLIDNSVRLAVEMIMKLVVSNKKVYFHCAVGTDRTGTVAYILEGILGVAKKSRLDDYELSYFYREEKGHGKIRTSNGIVELHKAIKKYSNISLEQERYINWYLDGSSNKANSIKLINEFRTKMISGNPTVYKISSGKLKVSE